MIAVSSITNESSLSEAFRSAFQYVSSAMPPRFESTVAVSIACSLEGGFGDREVNLKTKINPVWVSPLTSLLWYLDPEAVARSKLYYKVAVAAKTSVGGHMEIERFLKSRPRPKRDPIPI